MLRNALVAISISTLLVLVSGTAQAASSLQFIWTDTGTPTITVTSPTSQEIRGGIVAVGDAAGMSGIFVSFSFDTDGKDELNIAPKTFGANNRPGGTEQSVNLPGAGNAFVPSQPGFGRNQQESQIAIPVVQPTGVPGLLGSFDVATGGSGLVSGTRTLGSIFFTTNPLNVVNDGVDVEIVILNDDFDAVLDGAGNDISGSVILGGGVVNSVVPSVPEPTVALLLLGGLGGLVAAGRRPRV